MERSAHIVANLFVQVVCILHLHTKSWTAMPVEARPISEQGVMESPSNGGAMIATNFAFRSMKEWPMTFQTQSSAVNVMCYLQHAGFTQLFSMVQKPLIGAILVMKDMRTMNPIMCMTLILHLTPHLRKMLVQQKRLRKRLNPDMRKRLNHNFRKMLNTIVRMLL